MPSSAACSDLAIATRGLCKAFRGQRGSRKAVQGLDLDVPVGGVHALLGPNGSGKTTTIRMLLGLVRADAGTMSMFGQPVPARLPEVIGRVGVLAELSVFYPRLSGRKNLMLLARSAHVPPARVDQVLEWTSMTARGKDPVRTYSLGMKERLGIAAALLKDPDLLIFDMAFHGHDPAGAREVRTIMRTLGDRGKTVLVSSHVLSAVERIADTVSIIGHGRLLTSGTVADVVGAASATSYRVSIADHAAARRVLLDAGMFVRQDGGQLVVDGVDDAALVTARLAEHGLYVRGLAPLTGGLEEAYMRLTKAEGMEAESITVGERYARFSDAFEA